jgi:AcrR family transcriptional regulator
LDREQTIRAFVDVARAEFQRYGSDRTDVARIGRLAGLAQTTFYRLFKDKTDIFLVVYRDWDLEEQRKLREFLCSPLSVASIVEMCVVHYRTDLIFRRNLRRLEHEEPRVRRAVGESRRERVRQLKVWLGRPEPDQDNLAGQLLLFEGAIITLAERDLAAMGAEDGYVRQSLAAILSGLGFGDRLEQPDRVPILHRG